MYLTVSGVLGAGFLASFPPVFVVLCCLIENTNIHQHSSIKLKKSSLILHSQTHNPSHLLGNGQLDAYRLTKSKT